MNEKINALLSGLSPELQEKAKGIKTQEELSEFLSENDIELPEDALEAVSGGCGEPEEKQIFPNACPDCGGDLEYAGILTPHKPSPFSSFGSDELPIGRCPKTHKTYVRESDVWEEI